MKNTKVIIGGYEYSVQYIPHSEMPGYDGLTYSNERTIKIRNDLDDTATLLIVTHEVVHALLATQGRVFQKKFDVEEVCELIANRLFEINEIIAKIKSAWEEHE